MTTLKDAHAFGLGDVAAIRCRTPPNGLNALIYARPVTGLQGKFSMEYALVATLLDGPPALPSFSDEAVLRPAAQKALALVAVSEDPACDPDATALPTQVTGSRGFVDVEVTLKDGRRLRQRVDHPPGHPSRELSWEDLGHKIAICLRHAGMDDERISRAREALVAFGTAKDVSPIVDTIH
jgi:2-methylcitrate dehydratase PrpD